MSLRPILAQPPRIGCPILRAFCEGWEEQKLRGRASAEEQWHPTLRQQREGWGTRSFCSVARNAFFDGATSVQVTRSLFSRAANNTAISGLSRGGTSFLPGPDSSQLLAGKANPISDTPRGLV